MLVVGEPLELLERVLQPHLGDDTPRLVEVVRELPVLHVVACGPQVVRAQSPLQVEEGPASRKT